MCQEKKIPVEDTLSHAFINDSSPEIPKDELNCFVHVINNHDTISKLKLSQFAVETSKDPVLKKVEGLCVKWLAEQSETG